MPISVLFFGATAAIAGTRLAKIELSSEANAGKVFDLVQAQYPGLASHRLFFSVNQQYATGDEIIRDGDELAIFTAVSGG